MLKLLDQKLSLIENSLVLFVGISIFIVMILTSIQIISRVVGYPWPAFLELSELAISIFAFLGVAYAQRMDAHIRMELLVANLKGRIKWLVEFISTLVSFIVISICKNKTENGHWCKSTEQINEFLKTKGFRLIS